MIRSIYYILMLTLFFWGCKGEFATPPEEASEFMRPTCHIGQLRSLTDSAPALPMIISEAVVIHGIITTSDSSGNIYKSLYVEQDGAAAEIKLNVYDIYRVFPIGSTVGVNLQGVAIDTLAGGCATIGPINTWPIIGRHIKLQPAIEPLTPEKVKLEEIDNHMIGRTVELCNVEFVTPDTTYSGSQKLRDTSGGKTTLTLYTSPYCSFANEPLPPGALDIRALVGVYNRKLQLRINSRDCVRPVRDIIFDPENGANRPTRHNQP